MKYNIFISYRRTAFDTANLIAEKLRNAGYHVFFDVDTLTSGKFNEQLLEVIKDCKDFILVLPEGALDRCEDEADWIRREVLCAMQCEKNIIPVMLDGFVWPKELPQGMEELPNYQAIASNNRDYFDMSVQRLIGYLKSEPSVPIKKWLTRAAIIVTVLFTFLAVGFGIVRHIAMVTCEKIATQQATLMGVVDEINDICKNVGENSTSFFSALSKNTNEVDRHEMEADMIAFLNKTEKDIQVYKKSYPTPDFNLNGIETYVLAFYGITQEDLSGFSIYFVSFFDDAENIIAFSRGMVDSHNYSTDNKDMLSTNLNCISYSINAFYYGYLGCLSLFPKSTRKTHYEMAKKWKHYPNGVPLDLPQEEYERFMEYENNRLEKELDKMDVRINYEERKLNDIEKQIEQLQEALKKE